MTRRRFRPRLAVALVAAAAVTGCGAAGGSASPGSSAAGQASAAATARPAGAGVTSGAGLSSTGVTATLTAVPDASAGTLVVTAAVTGPATLVGGCQPTLSVTLLDSAGVALAPTGLPGVRCLAIADLPIAGGETRRFSVSVPLPHAHGIYTVQARLNGGGDLPSLTLSI